MTQKSAGKSKTSSTAHRFADKTLDVAVGGTALAADKVAKTVDRVVEKAEEAMRKGRREAHEKAEAAGRAAHRVIDDKDSRPYEDRTREELYDLAAEREIEGRSAMRKSELIAALRSAR